MKPAFLKKGLSVVLSGLLFSTAWPSSADASESASSRSVAVFKSQALSPAVVMMAGQLKPSRCAARECRLLARPSVRRLSARPWVRTAIRFALLAVVVAAAEMHPSIMLAALLPLERPSDGQEITIVEFPIDDSVAVEHLLREIKTTIAEIEHTISTLDETSPLRDLLLGTHWAFQDIEDALDNVINHFPEAIFIARTAGGQLAGIRILDRPSGFLAHPNFPNALGGTDVVKVTYQGRGIATNLTVHALQWARNHGFDYYLALIHRENQASLKHFANAVTRSGMTCQPMDDASHDVGSHLKWAVRLREIRGGHTTLMEQAA